MMRLINALYEIKKAQLLGLFLSLLHKNSYSILFKFYEVH